MPLSFKEQKHPKNNRKPLTNSTNNKDPIQRKSQKSHKKNNVIKSSQQKLINRSSLNIKTYTPYEEETSHKKLTKDRLYQEILKLKPTYQARETFMKLHESSFSKTDNETTKNNQSNELSRGRDGTQSPSLRLKQSWGKLKQVVGKQVYFYDKYSKKDINISIIEQKSLLSNNQQNSLDSLNNFIIEGNNQDGNKSLKQNSHESSSFDEDEVDNDWSQIEKQYEYLIGGDSDNNSSQRQAEYLRILGLGRQNSYQSEQKVSVSDQLRSEFFTSMTIQIDKLNDEIRKLHEMKNRKETIMVEGLSMGRQIVDRQQREKSAIQQQSETIIIIGNNQSNKNNIQQVVSSDSAAQQQQRQSVSMLALQQNEKSLALSIQRSAELKSIVQNFHRDNNSTIKYNHIQQIQAVIQKKVLLSFVQDDTLNERQQVIRNVHQKGQLRLKEEQMEEVQLQGQQEQQELVIIQQSQYHSQSITQQKSQQQFIRYMDKEYLQKKQSEDNQANLSLNNISKIINIKPKQLHNKSIEIQHQMKQKQDDEVVAMLQNELRGKQQGKQRKRRQALDIGYKLDKLSDHHPPQHSTKINHPNASDNTKMPSLFLHQGSHLLQLKQQQQQQQQPLQNEIILKDSQSSDIIVMKQAPDNLNQCQYQISLQPDQLQQHNDKFFLALQAREKWIESLQKDTKWKKNQLQLISKMKKILHNPYIEFQDY